MIEIKNVWKRYLDKTVLEKVSLHVAKHEFITIVGASGCGKTTFLRMLLGEIEPSEGEILIEGDRMRNEPDGDRGVVFQRYSVFPHMTVLENVRFGLDLKHSRFLGRSFKRAREDSSKLAGDMLARVGLQRNQDNYPAELSGGMQQRLALAQTLIMTPRVLLLDEPFGALDPGYRADMHELLLDLFKELDLTVFMITHDISEGFSLGSRLLVFDKPRVDPHDPELYGATITFDLPVGPRPTLASIVDNINVKPENVAA
ncbi:MAG: ABC transporter ATP-binding protein [Gammaproteobacteria bacterium]|nr:ABC transporter ATP-binding protein [Gammaproteobacteria bacterium]